MIQPYVTNNITFLLSHSSHHSLISFPKVGFTMSACGAKAAPPLDEQVLPNNFPLVTDGPAAEDVYNESFPSSLPTPTSPLCPPTARQRTHSEHASCRFQPPGAASECACRLARSNPAPLGVLHSGFAMNGSIIARYPLLGLEVVLKSRPLV